MFNAGKSDGVGLSGECDWGVTGGRDDTDERDGEGGVSVSTPCFLMNLPPLPLACFSSTGSSLRSVDVSLPCFKLASLSR